MMNLTKVWVIQGQEFQEGFEILGIFDSEEKAKEAKADIEANSSKSYYYDSYEVVPFNLNEIYEG